MLWILSLLLVLAGDDVENAKKLHERGSAAYAVGRYAEAAAAFEDAYLLKPDPALLYNAAQAHRLGGNREKALTLYRNYLRIYPNQPNRPEIERRIEELRRPAPVTTPPVTNAPAPLLVSPRPDAQVDAAPSLVQRPVFWIVVGAAVIGAAVAVGLSLGGRRDPRPTLGAVDGN